MDRMPLPSEHFNNRFSLPTSISFLLLSASTQIADDTDSTEYLWESPAYGNRNMVQFINLLPAVGKPVLLAINNGR
jgi:hypothetical protein